MELTNEIEKVKTVVTELLREQFEAQGHKMSGKLIDDIEYVVNYELARIVIEGKMYPYAKYLDRGVGAGNIPFSGTGKRGGVSQYIQALKKYAEIRMNVSSDKSLGVAFAIAHTQKREGMPTYNSYRFSSTGKRLEFIEEALKDNRLTDIISVLAYKVIEYNVESFVRKWNVELNKN